MRLKDKTAVITGGGSGIGRAIALRFAAEAARVVIAELDEASGSETARMAHSRGAESFAVVTDVGSRESVAAMFKAIDDRDWTVDILVDNAGGGGDPTPVHLMTDEVWQSLLNVYLNGTFYCTREAVNRMLPRGTGVFGKRRFELRRRADDKPQRRDADIKLF